MTNLSLTKLMDTAPGWPASQDALQTLECLLGMLPLTSWPAMLPCVLIVFVLAASIGAFVWRILTPAKRIGRRVAIYILERFGNIIVDRLLEAIIVILLAFAARCLANFCRVLNQIFR